MKRTSIHMNDDLGKTRCPICDLQYLAALPEERRLHNKRCKHIKKINKELGTPLLLLHEREELKREARRILESSTDPQERLDAQKTIIFAHFSRSAMRYNPGRNGRKHPTLQDYIRRYPRTHIKGDLIPFYNETYGQADVVIDSMKDCCYCGEA